MYVDHYEKLVDSCNYSPSELKYLDEFKVNMEMGMALCLVIAQKDPYPNENLASIPPVVNEQQQRLEKLYNQLQQKLYETQEYVAPSQVEHAAM